ncbi:TPA: hypothetical protein HA338_03300 [Methanosarcina acetivorans]|nr:hypothetical protein [Methanosarcina acetivorans]HIH93091.1 hypothetical protein [Methanosarcina acetivorans]
MYEAGIEMTNEDFEFAKLPLSKKFIRLIFEKYQLDYIAYFGENMFYVSGQNSQPLTPLYPNARYPEDIELVLDFMARERIRRIKYEGGILFRSAVPELRDSGNNS